MVITTKRLFISVAIVIVFLLVSIFLQQVFFGAIILSQTFSLGFITIHYYGILMAAAVAAAFYLAIRRAPKYGVDVKQAEDLLFWLIIFGFIGARLYHVLSSISYYWIHPLDTLKVWNGGLSIYGALLGGLFILWCYFKIHNSKFPPSADRPGAGIILNLLDWLAPSVVLGQIIGRFGNFFNYEAFGYPASLPWKMFVPFNFRPEQYQTFSFFHPFFLYEVLGNTIVLILLLLICKRVPLLRRPGSLFFSYILLYNSLRFGLEFLRIDSTFIAGLRLNAIVSLFLVLISLGFLIYKYKHA